MDDVQTPEEKGKRILEQQAQQQKLIEEQEEEAELEAARQRRLKERAIMAFFSYLKAVMEQEKSDRLFEKQLGTLREEFLRQHLQQAQLFNRMLLNNLSYHNSAVSDFVYAEETEADMARRGELLHKVGMDKSDFSTLTMADLCKQPENREDAEKIFSGRQPSEKIRAQRRVSLLHADEALLDFSKGNIKKMENILKTGLVNACHAFSQTKDTLNAIHWSKQINGILSVINTHPVLFRNGADSTMLETATGMAALGRVMENGLKALDELFTARMNGTQIPAEQEMKLQSEILLMQQTDAQRSSEQYRKFFTKIYHPKKGLQEESLKTLLKQLNTSESMYTLSNMDKEEKLFALSDADSRRTLSESLFVPHTEKKVKKPEKAVEKPPEKPAPGIHF